MQVLCPTNLMVSQHSLTMVTSIWFSNLSFENVYVILPHQIFNLIIFQIEKLQVCSRLCVIQDNPIHFSADRNLGKLLLRSSPRPAQRRGNPYCSQTFLVLFLPLLVRWWAIPYFLQSSVCKRVYLKKRERTSRNNILSGLKVTRCRRYSLAQPSNDWVAALGRHFSTSLFDFL